MLTPVLLVLAPASAVDLMVDWELPVIGAALVLSNYFLLARAYGSGDLSVVYPISRGAILVFLPALGFVAFGERISAVGAAAILLIISGIAFLPLSGLSRPSLRATRRSRHDAVGYAILAALFAALYTIWSKLSISVVPAFEYFYAYTTLTAIAMLAVAWRTARALRAIWREHWWAITRVAALNSVAYLLVLAALDDVVSTYLIGIRQLSIVWGVLLARYALGESVTLPQKAAVAVLVIGCLLVSAA